MKAADRVSFGGGGLERQALRRRDAKLMLSSSSARALPLWRGRPLVQGTSPATLRLVRLATDHPFVTNMATETVFLGAAGDETLFAVDVSSWHSGADVTPDAGPGRTGEDQPAPDMPGLPADARFADLRGMIAGLGPLDAEIAATSRGILEWHRNHRFCARCGAASDVTEGGWQRRCPACGAAHFPRTDPVVIMLVTRGNKLLIGRSPGWPEGFYSLLAGFMEPGETVAMAVRREVDEETGVQLGAVQMLTSQPWPFPASLMIGCCAEAQSSAIHLDPVELDDALWVTRETLLEIFAHTHKAIHAPRAGAIAHFLMQMWLADRLD